MTKQLLNLLKHLIRLKFPSVSGLSISEFDQASDILILDARSKAEYAVSHLLEAKQVDPNSDLANIDALENTTKETPIAVYCSVGYRSAKVAQKLQQLGFQNVFNLEGGLFEWANEGKEIVRNGQLTQWVHPYSANWGVLLKKQHRFDLSRENK